MENDPLGLLLSGRQPFDLRIEVWQFRNISRTLFFHVFKVSYESYILFFTVNVMLTVTVNLTQ